MSSIEIFFIIAAMAGGLALFLFGMNTMSSALSTMTGGALDRLLGVITKNRVTAFLFGTGLTAIVQSSSAVSVLTVGLVNSGIILLPQAVGLLIGGSLGSTATAWLLSLNALDGQSLLMTIIKPSSFSPFLAIVGVAITMFAKRKKKIQIGYALLGFAVMMIGMNLMSQGVAPLKELPALQSALVSFSNPIIGFLIAVAITMLIQCSDATIGIVQAFALSVGISYGMAIPLICGAQVGTCVTALISSLSTSNDGKRTAIMNLYYALLKVIPFMVLFYGANTFCHFAFLENSVGGIGIGHRQEPVSRPDGLECAELHYTVTGCGIVEFDGRRHLLPAGTMLYSPILKPHRYYPAPGAGRSTGFRFRRRASEPPPMRPVPFACCAWRTIFSSFAQRHRARHR